MSDKHTPAFKAGNYWYEVLIPGIFLKSNAQLRVTGIVVSGDPARDRENLLADVPAQLRIVDMAELLAEGASFSLIYPEKAPVIYGIITDILNDWRFQVERTIVAGEVPLDDLRKLDALASEIYKTAKLYIKPNDVAGFFSAFDVLTSRPMLPSPSNARNVPKPKQLVKQEHTPIADAISATVINGGIPWK